MLIRAAPGADCARLCVRVCVIELRRCVHVKKNPIMGQRADPDCEP